MHFISTEVAAPGLRFLLRPLSVPSNFEGRCPRDIGEFESVPENSRVRLPFTRTCVHGLVSLCVMGGSLDSHLYPVPCHPAIERHGTI